LLALLVRPRALDSCVAVRIVARHDGVALRQPGPLADRWRCRAPSARVRRAADGALGRARSRAASNSAPVRVSACPSRASASSESALATAAQTTRWLDGKANRAPFVARDAGEQLGQIERRFEAADAQPLGHCDGSSSPAPRLEWLKRCAARSGPRAPKRRLSVVGETAARESPSPSAESFDMGSSC